MRSFIITLLAIAFCFLGLSSCHRAPIDVSPPFSTDNLDRAKAIELYLTGRPLKTIEGIWLWDNNNYEIAIVQNMSGKFLEYDYSGIVTDTQVSRWKRGEVKIFLKETAASGVFSGTYLMANKSKHGTTFFLTSFHPETLLF